MMSHSCLFLLFLLPFSLHAQVVPVQGIASSPIDQSIFSQWASEVDHETSENFIKGSPYLFDHWAKGQLQTIKGGVHENVDLKLNLFTGHLIYKNPLTNDSTLILAEFLKSYELQSSDTLFTFYHIPPRRGEKAKVQPEDFYLVLSEGDVLLLARPEVKIKRATRNTLVNADGQMKDRYSRTNAYYLLLENGEIVPAKRSRNAFVRVLTKHQEKMKDYLRKQKTDLSNSHDLMQVISYYNTLESQ